MVPGTGGGAVARPFEMAGSQQVVLERGGLTITAFKVDCDPIKPALGYRFDYKGRSLPASRAIPQNRRNSKPPAKAWSCWFTMLCSQHC